MKRLVKLLVLVAVIAAVAVMLKRRPAPPSASPTGPPTPVTPKASVDAPQVPTMPTVSAPDPSTEAADTWAEPTDDGGCPDGHPVKAKASSKIFHVPGGVLYDKTVPDRCYTSPEAAEADGYRASLR
jgi:hypothetical protein